MISEKCTGRNWLRISKEEEELGSDYIDHIYIDHPAFLKKLEKTKAGGH